MENNILEALNYIDPARLDYQGWVNVGMALKHEGYTANIWDQWSKNDPRYKSGECYRKWSSFKEETNSIVTGGTIVQLAKEQGYSFYNNKEDRELDFDDYITEDFKIIDKDWLEGKEIEEPSSWDPAKEIKTYLSSLFESNEYVGYVTSTYETEDGKHLPKKGSYDRTAGELLELIDKNPDDLSNVFGTIDKQAGAWIRFNPLDGQGVKNANVTDFRYALVESDSMEIEKQNAILRELELPIAVLVYSGGKSIHAIVKIDAANYDEYRKRVDYLYNVCEKNGLEIDKQNRNPSRLSRMPGVLRNGKKQHIIDLNIGKSSWTEWEEWIEGINDDLPDPEPLTDVWEEMPPLAPPLIENVLRQGHKMLLAGPSKAGKSFALIELCIAIAEGTQWLGRDCTQGRVLYVNLELDRPSALHRFKDVYKALDLKPTNINNIDIWNLRGKSVPLDKLAPKLIRRAQKRDYIAVVIDPIYKVITGDENSASEMAHFTNQFDKIATDLGCAVIYCHHHSKGLQGNKRSMDRASGSGVFARDPDALLDLTELDLNEDDIEREKQVVRAQGIYEWIRINKPSYFKHNIEPEEELDIIQMRYHQAKLELIAPEKVDLEKFIEFNQRNIHQKTAWRIEGTLREYPSFDPIDIWFEYPIHTIDNAKVLKDVQPEMEKAPWQRGIDSRKSKEEKQEERLNKLEIAYSNLEVSGLKEITMQDLADELGIKKRTVANYIDEHSDFEKVKQVGFGLPDLIKRKEK